MIILRRGERPSYFLFLKGEIFESGRWLNYNANWVPKLTEFHMLNLEHWLERTWTPNIRASMKLGTLETLHSAPSFANKRNTLIPEISSRLPEGNVSSVQFSHSVVSNSLQPHVLKRARLPCPSPTPRAYSNSCPSSQWHHPTISSSVIPFSSCLQSFLASGSFPMSQFFASGGQSIGVSASSNEYSALISFRIYWLDLLAVKETLKSLLQHHSSKASILQHLAFFIVQLSYPYMTTVKTIVLTRWTFAGKVMSLLFIYFF